MPSHALLLPIGHTVCGTGAYSGRHDSFTPLALAGESARANIGFSGKQDKSGRLWEST